MAPVEVALADHTVRVVGQKHAYLLHEIPRFLAKLPGGASEVIDAIDGDLGKAAETLPAFLGEHAYEALTILIPGLKDTLPEYEFRGYGSREAMETGAYDPALDKSPSFDQIVAAFEAVITVNRFDVFKHLGGALGAAGADPTKARSMISQSSPARSNGSAALTSSGTSPRT